MKDYSFNYQLWRTSLRQARQGRGLSQTSLGDVISKTKSTISRYESGVVMPEIVDFLALCFFFDWNPLTFLTQTEAMNKTAYMFDELRNQQPARNAQVTPLS